jgi:hypothetical protein
LKSKKNCHALIRTYVVNMEKYLILFNV